MALPHEGDATFDSGLVGVLIFENCQLKPGPRSASWIVAAPLIMGLGMEVNLLDSFNGVKVKGLSMFACQLRSKYRDQIRMVLTGVRNQWL